MADPEQTELDKAEAMMEKWAAEAEVKKKKEAAAKEAVDRAKAEEGNFDRGAKQGRGGLGKHTSKLLDEID